jgi:hypothetical protein
MNYYYAFKTPLKSAITGIDKYSAMPAVSTEEGIHTMVKVDQSEAERLGVEIIERADKEGNVLICESEAYYNDDPDLLHFLEGEGFDVSGGCVPFNETL